MIYTIILKHWKNIITVQLEAVKFISNNVINHHNSVYTVLIESFNPINDKSLADNPYWQNPTGSETDVGNARQKNILLPPQQDPNGFQPTVAILSKCGII